MHLLLNDLVIIFMVIDTLFYTREHTIEYGNASLIE